MGRRIARQGWGCLNRDDADGSGLRGWGVGASGLTFSYICIMAKQYVFPEIPDEVQNAVHFVRLKIMEFNGVDPAIIYAFRKTDLYIKSRQRAFFSEEERKAWDDAIAEFQRANPGHILTL